MPRCFLLKRPNEVLKRTHNATDEEVKQTENAAIEEKIASEKDEISICQDGMELSPIKKKKIEDMNQTPVRKEHHLDIQSNLGNDSGFYEEYSLWKSPSLCSPIVNFPYRAVSPHLARTSYTVTNARTPKRCSSVPIEYSTPSKTQHRSPRDSPRTSNDIVFENVTPKKPTFATPVKPIQRTPHAQDVSSPMSTFQPRMSPVVMSRPRLSPIPEPSTSIFPVQTMTRVTNSPSWESPLRRPVLTRNQGFVRCFTPGLSPITATNQTQRIPSARPTYLPFPAVGGQLLSPFDPRLPFQMRPGMMTSSPRRIPVSVASCPRFGNSVATKLQPPTHYSPLPCPSMRRKAEHDTYVPLDLTRPQPPNERQQPEAVSSGFYLVQPVHAFLQREVISGPTQQHHDRRGQEPQRDTEKISNDYSQPPLSQPTMTPRIAPVDRPFSTPPSPQFARYQTKTNQDVTVQRPLSFSPASGPQSTEVSKSMKSTLEESTSALELPKPTIQSPLTPTDKPTTVHQRSSTEQTTMKHWKKSIVGQNPVEATVPAPLKLPEPKVEPPNPTLVRETSSPPLLNLLQAAGKLDIELINGGYGIRNPSFSELHLKELENIAANNGKENTKFKCPICLKEFTLLRLLNRHVKNHSDIKRYLCTFCGKGFNDTFDLKRHTRIHTGVKPYKCENCGKSFTQRCSLESHGKKVHGSDFRFEYKQRRNKMYVCEDCGHTTPDPEVHFIHLKENHPGCPALVKCHDKRQFKFNESTSLNVLRPVN